MGLTKRPRSIVFVGRLVAQKNVESLIDAMQGFDSELTIVGDGPLRADLERRAAGLRVTFAGVVPNENLPGLLNRHELFVLPSRYEGMPKVLLEAMACGLACVATDIPGNRDLIVDGESGLLCAPDGLG